MSSNNLQYMSEDDGSASTRTKNSDDSNNVLPGVSEELYKKNELIKLDETSSTTPLVKNDFDYQFNNKISSIDTKQRRNVIGTSIVDILSEGYSPLDLMNDNLLG